MTTLSHTRRLLPCALAALAACSGAGGSSEGATSGGGTATARAARAAAGPPSVSAGTTMTLRASGDLSSLHAKVGDSVLATAGTPALDARGETVIPAGATFLGRVTAVSPAPHPDAQGTLQLAFSAVRIGTRLYPVHGEVTSLATETRGRGVTATDAAKVGAGAVIGGVAGRVIGGNATGTVVGAAAGGAGGAVVAHATRTVDIVLPSGGAIKFRLTEPFVRAIASR